MPTHTRDELLTTVEVGRLLKAHPQTVRRWIKQGKLRASYTPSGYVRIRRADLDAACGLAVEQ